MNKTIFVLHDLSISMDRYGAVEALQEEKLKVQNALRVCEDFLDFSNTNLRIWVGKQRKDPSNSVLYDSTITILKAQIMIVENIKHELS